MGGIRRAGHSVSTTLSVLTVFSSVLALGMPQVASGATVSPRGSTIRAQPHLPGLNPNQLSTRADCASARPGYARCASEQLIYRASGAPVRTVSTGSSSGASPAATPASVPAGYGPSELQSAYNLTSLAATQGEGETIAVVDAYDNPNAESDLAAYRSQYGLPACAAGCFSKVNQSGGTTYPQANEEWSAEISLDLDMASAICPKCHLLLVEATEPSGKDLAEAENTAAKTTGVVAISNSYGTSVSAGKRASWGTGEAEAYDHPGVAITASAGDKGYEVQFPAVLGTVTAVGGTSLVQSGSGIWSEEAWSGTGGGCSEYVEKPSWQTDSGCTHRVENDMSADANPYTGAAVYDTYMGGWVVFGGTSESSPIVAGFYALIGKEAGFGGASWDYAHPAFFNDVTSGSNASGCTTYLCEAIAGYDGPTGLGTPDGIQTPLVITEHAGEVTATGATLSGTVNPNGGDTSYHFQYGTSTAYGASTEPRDGGSGTSSVSVNPASLTGLSPGTTYHYQLVAVKGGRIAAGQDQTFTTLATTGSASSSGVVPSGGAGSGSGSVGSESPTSPSRLPATTSSSPTTGGRAPAIYALALTAKARAALRHGERGLIHVGFSFRLSQAATVRVILRVRVGSGAHRHWRTLRRASLRFAAVKGLNRHRLHGPRQLARGVYRLTVTPIDGRARSVVIHV